MSLSSYYIILEIVVTTSYLQRHLKSHRKRALVFYLSRNLISMQYIHKNASGKKTASAECDIRFCLGNQGNQTLIGYCRRSIVFEAILWGQRIFPFTFPGSAFVSKQSWLDSNQVPWDRIPSNFREYSFSLFSLWWSTGRQDENLITAGNEFMWNRNDNPGED